MTQLAHALAGLVLILSFALLGQQRLRPMVWLCAVQTLGAALAVALQGNLTFALVAFALNGLLLPLVLARMSGDERVTLPGRASWIGGVVLAAVSVAVAMQVSAGRVEMLGSALAVLVLGLLQSARSPIVGLLSAQNGLILLVAAVPNAAPLALVAVALPIMPAILALASRSAAMTALALPSRFGASVTVALTTLLFLLACVMVSQPPHHLWSLDIAPPNAYLVLLVSFVAMVAAWLNLYVTQGLPRASIPLLVAVVLALLSDDPAITWLMLALAMVATSARGDPAAFLPFAAAMLLALAGTLLLYFATGSASLAWSGAPLANGRVLSLAGIFLLIGYGSLAIYVSFPATSLLVTVPLLVMLRLRQLGLAPELLLALGLAALLVAAVQLRRTEMAVSHAAMAVLGLSVFALGLGEPDAALLLVALLVLVVLAMRQPMERLANLLLAALPLLALYLLAGATVARSLWLLPPLAFGAIAASVMTVR